MDEHTCERAGRMTVAHQADTGQYVVCPGRGFLLRLTEQELCDLVNAALTCWRRVQNAKGATVGE